MQQSLRQSRLGARYLEGLRQSAVRVGQSRANSNDYVGKARKNDRALGQFRREAA